MDRARRLPATRREPPGLERRVLRNLPGALAGGTLATAAAAASVRLFPPDLPALELAKHFGVVDAVAIGMVTFVWVAMLTVAIACAIVCVMKGPGYVADGYSVSDRDTPADD